MAANSTTLHCRDAIHMLTTDVKCSTLRDHIDQYNFRHLNTSKFVITQASFSPIALK